MTQQIIFGLVGAAIGGIVIWLISNRRRPPTDDTQVHQYFSTLQQHVTERLDKVSQQVDRRLKENVYAMNESKSFLANRVTSTERAVRDVTAGLSKLQSTTAALKSTTDEISSFQNLLKSPKVRGSFGEVLLNNLMADVLPQDRYQAQYALPSTGEIADAIIKLQDNHIVAIDAKFPLASYEHYAQEQDPERKRQLRTAVVRDIKKHISDISTRYISPSDNTLDYAFMYIPVEGVYYETMVRDEAGDSLWDLCLQQHVIPVSPNSFLAYLQTVLIGLRGMKIEQQAQEILQHLGQVRRDFSKFNIDFAMVGKHLTNAKNRYDDTARKLDKFSNRFDQIETGEHTPQIDTESESDRAS